MSFFYEEEILPSREKKVLIDGCVNFTAQPDPASASGMGEYKDVYAATFGSGGLFETLNRAIALCRAANPRLLKIPGNVIEAQKQNWMQLGNDSGMSKDEVQKLPKKIAGNLNKLKTTNVLVPEAIAYVSTVFHDAHMGMRTAGLLPAAEEVKELENISTVT